MSLRDQLLDYVRTNYQAEPEYLWIRYPNYAVFRHTENRKWFGFVADVRRRNLGLDGDEIVDILNVKLGDPLLADLLLQQPGYLHGYHFRRGNWVSILLDGSVPLDDICRWLEESYRTTAPKPKKRKKSREDEP